MAPPALDQPPYTIHNLPYGVISTSAEPAPRCAVAIGQHAIDLSKYAKESNLSSLESGHDLAFPQIFEQPALNTFAALPWPTRRAVRQQLQDDLKAGKVPDSCLLPLKDVRNHLPMQMSGFSDFYTSLDHCKNCSGELTTAAIPKNWYYAPSVYNSRVSSVVPSPTPIRRPTNISFSGALDSEPIYGPSRKLDYELEMGYFVSTPIRHGSTLTIASAKQHIFGFVLLNDWSARDHQVFEMRPLGPFHSKGFGTSISTWVVPMEALEPFAVPTHLPQAPPPFPHLAWPHPASAALDIKLRVSLLRPSSSSSSSSDPPPPRLLATSNLKYLYWTPYQQLAHHAASACGMRTGDLLGTGTISGSGRDAAGAMAELGCLYEAERTGTRVLPELTAEQREADEKKAEAEGRALYQEGYLRDGDEILLEGWCEDRQGNVVLGFGECRGRILPPAAAAVTAS